MLLAYGISLCAQSGDLGSIDAIRRLRVAHSWWTSSAPVPFGDDPSFGVWGRDGVLHASFGPAQSLVMLPADVVASALVRVFVVPDQLAERFRIFFVSLATFPLISALAVLVAFELLRALAFSGREAALGALSLLLATSLLHYTQINQENSLQLLLTLTAFLGMARWVTERRLGFIVLAGISVGANLLLRLVTAIDGVFVVLFGAAQLAEDLVRRTPAARRGRRVRPAELLAFTGPVAAAVVAERLYHHHRFGSWWGTYLGIFRAQRRALQPWLPSSFPFSGDFWDGFLGVLVTPARSVLLFDATIVLTVILLAAQWKDHPRGVRHFFLAGVGILLATAAFYAKYRNWTGASAWGARYCTVASELIGLLAVPLLVRWWSAIRSLAARVALVSVLAYAVVVQLLSVPFWFVLEETQCRGAGTGCFVILMRARNLLAAIHGQLPAVDPITPRMVTPNFFPFIAARVVSAPAALALQAVWWGLLATVSVATMLVARRWWRRGASLTADGGDRPARPGTA